MEQDFFESMHIMLNNYISFIRVIEALANIAIFYVFYTNIRKLFWRKVELSCGSFRIRQMHFTVQNVTNVVSLKYYNGGIVLDEVRKEMLKATCLKTKDL